MFNSTFHILLNASQCFTSCSECVEAMPGCLTQHLHFTQCFTSCSECVETMPGCLTQHFTFYSMIQYVLLLVQNVLRLCQDVLLNISHCTQCFRPSRCYQTRLFCLTTIPSRSGGLFFPARPTPVYTTTKPIPSLRVHSSLSRSH